MVVVVALVEPVTPEVPPIMELLPLLVEPGPPMALVLPDVSPLVGPGIMVPPVLLPPMALLPPMPLVPGVPLLLEVDVSVLGAGVVVDELDDDVGVGA